MVNDLPAELPRIRKVGHKIEVLESGVPPYRSSYQLSPTELLASREYITKLHESSKIRYSRSPYRALLFFVKEKNKLRGVIDYRGLNRIIKKNRVPIRGIDEMFERLGEAKCFSRLSMKTGIQQIRINPSDKEKAAFNSRYGHFEFLVMPMGLCNAPATFQTLMDWIFFDILDKFTVIYIDDILVYNSNEKDHGQHLDMGLSKLREQKLFVGRDILELFATSIRFLRIQCIKEWPKPKSISELQSFVGLLQVFRRFI